jgi:hypothetical protein
VGDFRTWPWSSYGALIADEPTHLCREAVLSWFGGRAHMDTFRQGAVDEQMIAGTFA